MDPYVRQLCFEDLDGGVIQELICLARDEDLSGYGLRGRKRGEGIDLSASALSPTSLGDYEIRAREPMVVCGLGLLPIILEAYGWAGESEVLRGDGEAVQAGTPLAVLRGSGGGLLGAERVLLNFLQLLSGIATLTRRYVLELGDSRTKLLDTRKTPPAYRFLAKWAFACGGGYNHRFGLWDRVMLKDNHLAGSGKVTGDGLRDLILEVKRQNPGVPVEVEIDSPGQLAAVIEAGAEVVLFDNFRNEQIEWAVAECGGRCLTEASGGIVLERLASLAGMGLDFISTGAPIHRARWVDIGMDFAG